MTKADVQNGIIGVIQSFGANPEDNLSPEQQTELTDLIASYCETVKPTNDYPPVKK